MNRAEAYEAMQEFRHTDDACEVSEGIDTDTEKIIRTVLSGLGLEYPNQDMADDKYASLYLLLMQELRVVFDHGFIAGAMFVTNDKDDE